MDEVRIKGILRLQKERYKAKWSQLWNESKGLFEQFREIILSEDNLSISDIRKWRNNLPDEIGAMFRYVFINDKQGKIFLNNPELKKLLVELETAGNPDKCDALFLDALSNLKGGGVSIISTWWAIFKPNLFFPIWGVKPKGSIITEKFERETGVTIEKLLGDFSYAMQFISKMREISKSVGIDNMIEVAYYLSKYVEEIETSSASLTENDKLILAEYFQSKGYHFSDHLIAQFYTALKTKGFVILSGLSGTGKTKIALELVKLLESRNKNYIFLSVRPDWRDSKPLLGYYNPLTGKYHKTPLLEFILRAIKDYEQNKEKAMPYFIILDEMNLAHVEYYFADFLSILESGRDESGFTIESIKLHDINDVVKKQEIPKEIRIPPNLYIIGTVNIDETTYMFSPKVLDRAFTIEFHDVEFEKYPPERTKLSLEEIKKLRDAVLDDLRRNGRFLAVYKKAKDEEEGDIEKALKELKDTNNGRYWEILKQLNKALKPYDLHFGYRVVDESALFFKNAKESWNGKIITFENEDEIFDLALLMKILPKFHGNRKKLEKPLKTVLKICLKENQSLEELNSEKIIEMLQNWETERKKFKFSHTAKKVLRMLRQLYEIGFASFS